MSLMVATSQQDGGTEQRARCPIRLEDCRRATVYPDIDHVVAGSGLLKVSERKGNAVYGLGRIVQMTGSRSNQGVKVCIRTLGLSS